MSIAPPIFILSPLPRCGTNFLWDLLRLHPACATGRSPIWEDYLLKNAPLLQRYAAQTQSSWDPVWGPTEHLRPELLQHLGDALIAFLTIDPHRRLLTKSPTIQNLDLFFELFPDAALVLLMRDGRDVVHSGMRTFGWTLEGGARAWARGAQRVVDFVAAHADEACHLVRYENLVRDPRGELKQLLDDLHLDAETYDYDAADRLPVRGSSWHRGSGRDAVHWDPVAPDEAFVPLEYWRAWSSADQRTFLEIAGFELRHFGYEA